MYAPEPKLAACLRVLYCAAISARALGWRGEQQGGLTAAESTQLAALGDAVHNIPDLVAHWERCDEELLRTMLGDYDTRHRDVFSLLGEYDRVVRERSGS